MSAVTVAPFPRRLAGNPYCDLLYRGVAETGTRVVDRAELSLAWVVRNRRSVQVLHIHWPELYYRGPGGRVTARSAAGFLAALLAARALGYRIVWTVHNALPHEGRSHGDRALRWVLFRTARLVVHAESARRVLPHGGRDAAVVPHGHYIDVYPRAVDREQARRRLGLAETETVFLVFGQIRAYKGIPDLLAAFAALDVPGVRLVIAGGAVDSMLAASVRREAARDPRVVAHLAHVADEDVQGFFEAADWVVLPYRDVLTSGSALLALSCGRPVIAPRRGCLAELGEGEGMLAYDPDVPGALGVALAQATRIDAVAWRPRALAAARRADWGDIARAYERIFVGG
jgi:glycosyltransferase involved in cell wall biosynthesis